MNFRLHPEARRDLREAATFYREQAGSALARSLLGEFDRSVALLLQHPRLGAVWLHGKRRLLMRRFPYAIIYTVDEDEIMILAVSHHSRHPEHWQDRE